MFIFPFLGILSLALYFVPTMIGFQKRNAGAIFALNLFLGWTVIGWVVSLVWALTKEDGAIGIAFPPANTPANGSWMCSTCRAALVGRDPFCRSCGTRIGWPS